MITQIVLADLTASVALFVSADKEQENAATVTVVVIVAAKITKLKKKNK